jgi:hemerythrin superfamily protein
VGVTDVLKEQHKEILELAEKLSSCMNLNEISRNASGVRDLLSEYSRILTYHLTLEDEALYPALVNHTDEYIKTRAMDYLDKLSGLKHIFTEYLDRWPTAESVQVHPDEFIRETAEILEVISFRINLEESDIYQLVDRD